MDLERIDAALREATDTRRVLIGSGVLGAVDDVFSQCFADQATILIADDNTYAAAGSEVEQRLSAAGRGIKDRIVFPGRPALYADYDSVMALEARLRAVDGVPLVVGSGTLNDITKLASYRVGRQYI
jgi:glycerol-1-phosphate dehydrogenase [NAD(P)+]